MITPISTDTRDKVAYFKKYFQSLGYGEGHYVLACHAAFPLGLTPDLLYQLWANFKKYQHKSLSKSIEFIAVSDILLSPLCREVRRGIFEMDMETRAFLLNELVEDKRFGQARIKQLGYFLYQYIQEIGITKHDKAFVDAQTWTALATIAPQQAANEITAALKTAIEKQNDNEIFRMRNLLESFSNQEAAFENLLHYTKGIKAALLSYPREVIQEQFDNAGAKVLTIEEGGEIEGSILEIPLLEEMEGKVKIKKEVIASTSYQKALNRIKLEKSKRTGKLDLSNLKLKRIPKELFDLVHLEILDLSSNKISTLPSGVRNFKNLKQLILSNNPIKKLPVSIGLFNQLTEIELDKGKLKDFPEALLKIQSLEKISLRNNEIDFLPPEIIQLEKLESINLWGNQVVNIPKIIIKTWLEIKDYFTQLKPDVDGKVLLLFTQDVNKQLKIGDEVTSIDEALKNQITSKRITIVHNHDISMLELFQYCYKYRHQVEILHFASGKLAFYSEERELVNISTSLASKLLGNLENCKLMIFNVPKTKEIAETISEKLNIACIGVGNKNITDKEAILFSEKFYQGLANGNSLSSIFKETEIIINN